MTRIRFLLWLDALLLAAFVVLQAPRASGLPGHEWGGVVFGAVILVHLLLNWRWIANTVRRSTFRPVRDAGAMRARVNVTLNALLFVMMIVTIFSGIVVSEVVLPSLGLAGSRLAAWRQVHNTFARFVVVVVGLHIALNWDWIVGALGKRSGIRSRTIAPDVVDEA